jgi:molybdenum cofactor synthesis domain-containing protein
MYNVAILTVSDRGSRGERDDAGGPAVKQAIEADERFRVVATGMVPDEIDEISATLLLWCKDHIPLILTTGGTGMSPRDVTPEATTAVIERPAPGFAAAMRQKSLAITPYAMLSRAVSGIRGQTLIINLPGSVKAAKECLAVILPALPHALDKLAGDPSECGRY